MIHMKSCYATLTRLYPPGFRESFAEEMTMVFEDARRERRDRGWISYLLFLVTELAGLLYGAVLAWRRGLSGKPLVSTVLPFLLGAFLSATLMRPIFYAATLRPRVISQGHPQNDVIVLLVLAAISVVLIAAFSVAFVVNLRILMRRDRRHSRA